MLRSVTTGPANAHDPADPLVDADPQTLTRLAKRAAKARSGPAGLEALATDVGVEPRRLRLLADAWDEGGEAGVAALGPAPSEADLGDVGAALEAWRARHHGLELLHWETWRNRVTVWRVVPRDDPRREPDRHPLCHLRRSDGGRWHLYRKAARGEWWPVVVVGRHGAQGLADCLDAVRADVNGAFWSPPRPPYPGGERRGPHRL